MSNHTCSIEGCERVIKARALCQAHYDRLRRHGDTHHSPLSPERPAVPCTIAGCDRRAIARGWCTGHYSAWRHHGDPLSRGNRGGTLHERFWAKVDKRGPDECWPWTAHIAKNGYGQFGYRRELYYAHRVALETKLGRPITDGLHACHTCDNRWCCNPAHLYEGTPRQNAHDCIDRGRNARGTLQWNHRLTEQAVREARDLYATGHFSHTELAARYGVGRATMGKALRREKWKHVA